MRLRNNLDVLLNHGTKLKILRFLFLENDEHTGRAIADSITTTASYTYKLLQELREEGIVTARKKGNGVLYRLKGDNYFVKKMLRPLFEKEANLYNDVMEYIKNILMPEKKHVLSICLFGSVVTGQETAKSDIDIAVIVKNSNSKSTIVQIMDKLSISMGKEFGVSIEPYIISKSEIIKKHSQKQPLITSIIDNNRLIYGEPIERILA